MELHLAYSNQVRPESNIRGFQQIRPDRMALFSSLGQASLYIEMCAAIDKQNSGEGGNGDYFAHALPLDPPPEHFEQLIAEENGCGWDLAFYPWRSLFHYPLRFDSNGFLSTTKVRPGRGIQTKVVREYNESLCKKMEPAFDCGDLVHIVNWEEYGAVSAVVVGIGVEEKFVRHWSGSEEWLGWYEVLLPRPLGCSLEHVHVNECEILPLTGQYSEYTSVLEQISCHIKGESAMQDEALDRLMQGGVSLNVLEVFPFNRFD